MLYDNLTLAANSEMNESTFRDFIDNILSYSPTTISPEMDEQEIEEILDKNQKVFEKKTNDGVIVKIGLEKISGRGLARYITLIKGNEVIKYVLWPTATSDNGINKVGLRSYTSENIEEGEETIVKSEDFVKLIMTIATYLLKSE